MNIQPPLLKKGDSIGVVAPSRVIQPSQMVRAVKVFNDWGLKLQLGNSLYASDGYFAGTDAERSSDLQAMLNSPDIKAIFCARGGYGMTRIIDSIDLASFKKDPKWVIGFSDITALHLALNRISVESIHGLMPVQYEYEGVELSLKSLHNLLFTGDLNYDLPGHELNRNGRVEAEIIGGNLSLLADSLGTSTEVDTNGKILFLEEIDEYLYKIDRMMTQLKRAGKFINLAGVIIGDFSGMKDTKIPFGKDVLALMNEYFTSFQFPVAHNVPVGHEAYNLAIPCGRKVVLKVGTDSVTLKG